MLGSLVIALLASQAEPKPIIAVFPIVDRRGATADDQILQLTDYLSVKITETGSFSVVARADIEAALRAQKIESYQACVDESCQIEIGKEVAAQKALQTQIVQVGDLCAVTVTLYDLKLAATEKAASHKGGCDANALVAALESVARQLADVKTTAAPPPAKPIEETYSLRVDSSPRRATVSVNGRSEGKTPATLKLPRGTSQELRVEREGYEPYVENVALDRDQQRSIELRMTTDRKRSRNEWFGASVSVGASLSGGIDLGLWLRFVNLHFGSFTLTVLEALGGPVFSKETREAGRCNQDEVEEDGYCRRTQIAPKVYVGPRLGFKLTFGGDHNLELAAGGGFFSTFNNSDDRFTGAAVSPTIRYLFLGDGKFSWGVGVRAILPIHLRSCLDVVEEGESPLAEYAACRNNRPFFFQLEIPIGWYF